MTSTLIFFLSLSFRPFSSSNLFPSVPSSSSQGTPRDPSRVFDPSRHTPRPDTSTGHEMIPPPTVGVPRSRTRGRLDPLCLGIKTPEYPRSLTLTSPRLSCVTRYTDGFTAVFESDLSSRFDTPSFLTRLRKGVPLTRVSRRSRRVLHPGRRDGERVSRVTKRMDTKDRRNRSNRPGSTCPIEQGGRILF